eukprot:1826577-Rhodomonas_salina.1
MEYQHPRTRLAKTPQRCITTTSTSSKQRGAGAMRRVAASQLKGGLLYGTGYPRVPRVPGYRVPGYPCYNLNYAAPSHGRVSRRNPGTRTRVPGYPGTALGIMIMIGAAGGRVGAAASLRSSSSDGPGAAAERASLAPSLSKPEALISGAKSYHSRPRRYY